MFKAKAILFLSIFLIFSYCAAQSQLFSFSKPETAILLNKDICKEGDAAIALYQYQSPEPKESILSFYRNAFRFRGLEEVDDLESVLPGPGQGEACKSGDCGPGQEKEVLTDRTEEQESGQKTTFSFWRKGTNEFVNLIFYGFVEEKTNFALLAYTNKAGAGISN